MPFLLAAFIAIIKAPPPPLLWLQQRKIPLPLAMLIVMMVLSLAGGSVILLVGTSLLEASSFPAKIRAIRQSDGELERMHAFLDNVQHYIAIKTSEVAPSAESAENQ